MAKFQTPSSTARQISGKDPSGHPILSVLFKLTLDVDSAGNYKPANKQLPLTTDPVTDDEHGQMFADTDLFPYKPATDIVVLGHAYPPRPGTTQFDAAVRVGNQSKTIRVIGDRNCHLNTSNQISFSPPAAITKVPLSQTHAYGGRDDIAEKIHGNPFLQFSAVLDNADLRMSSPYVYNRNPAGRGYLMEPTAAAVENLQLPNLEDPLDLLSPSRIVVGHPGNWLDMPLPQSTDWVDYGCFPRITFFGAIPQHDTPKRPVAEITRGFASADLLVEKTADKMFDFRCTNGASLGLALPYVKPGEAIELTNMHQSSTNWRFNLPSFVPKIFTDGRKGKMNSTKPVLHTVLIEPDESRVTLVWRGSAPALRPYMPAELEKMPFSVEY